VIGFRILKRTRKIDASTVAAFRDIPVANVSDSMHRMSAGGARLRPMHKGGRMAGPAFTVTTRPGDNLMVHKALDMAEPGDVLVVDAGGDLTNAIIGEINVPIAIDGMVIEPGDLVLGDGDGLLCVPFAHAAAVLQAASEKRKVEDREIPLAMQGKLDRAWVDKRLEQLGCPPPE